MATCDDTHQLLAYHGIRGPYGVKTPFRRILALAWTIGIPLRCQTISVPDLTVTRAEGHSLDNLESQTQRSRSAVVRRNLRERPERSRTKS